MEITKSFYPKSPVAWRKWLEKNHAKTKEIWIIFDKKSVSGHRPVSYQDALDEALCFGWIDGQVKGFNARQYAQRFTPRKVKSLWSEVNVRNYERLLAAGQVHEAGKRAFEAKHRIYNPRAESVIYAIKGEFGKRGSEKKAASLRRFFKTGKGEYAAGDRFWGVTVPETRTIAKKYVNQISPTRIGYILQLGRHEERMCMLFILVEKFKKGNEIERKKIFDFYLARTKYINNWDLVDSSASQIVGAYLHGKSKTILYKLARSKNLWERRIAIIATFYDIQKGDCTEALKIADMLLHDIHDLIHKAVGWMLREVGKRCGEEKLEKFLISRAHGMPRTMLRYAIERLPARKRMYYMEK